MFFVIPLLVGLSAATILLRARHQRLRLIAACMVFLSYAVIVAGLFGLLASEQW